MIDPYVDDALVSLSELRDARFADLSKFACGSNFVIGESVTEGTVVSCSPVKKASSKIHRYSMSQVSPIKESAAEIEMSMQLVSPDGSKQSFPQRALYQGSISPSTPGENNTSMHSYSGRKSLQFQPKELIGALKHVDGCKPVLSETPKNMPNAHHNRAKGGIFEVKHEETKTPRSGSASKINLVTKDREFNEP